MPRRLVSLHACLLCVALIMVRSTPAAELPDVAGYGERIVVQREIVFSAGNETRQKLDLYRPAGDGPFAVVICWHGGNFVGGSKADMARLCAFLADHGLAAAAANYHLARGDSPGWPKNVHDAKSAVRFLRRRAGEYRLAPDRLAALGHSAGAYLALMVGFTPQHEMFASAEEYRTTSDRVSAVVNIAGVCDRRASLGKGTANLLGPGFENNLELRTLASPVVHIGRGSPPVYTLQGLNDETVHPDSARQLDAALKSAGVPHQLQLVPNQGHNPVSVETMTSVADWLQRRFKIIENH
jgi:pectinesterase